MCLKKKLNRCLSYQLVITLPLLFYWYHYLWFRLSILWDQHQSNNRVVVNNTDQPAWWKDFCYISSPLIKDSWQSLQLEIWIRMLLCLHFSKNVCIYKQTGFPITILKRSNKQFNKKNFKFRINSFYKIIHKAVFLNKFRVSSSYFAVVRTVSTHIFRMVTFL